MDSEDIREKLYNAISEVDATCTFAVGGVANSLPLPGLSVAGVGTIALPLQEDQIKSLTAVSEQASFGKGADTVVDTDIRNCRQVDAKKITLNSRWQTTLQKLARDSANSLGVRGFNVVPSLYKLILYPPGGFFKPHKDTEKEPGMFATLVVQIPSKYDDGCLVVRHMREEKVFNFAAESDAMFYSATFYGDCEHELRTVQNGHRVCLVYNLLCTDNGPVPTLAEQDRVLGQIIEAADMWEDVDASDEPSKFALLMEHEYTNKNLAFQMLKGRDAAIVAVLRKTRRFDLHLALVQKHESGTPYNDFYERRRYSTRDDQNERTGVHHEMDDLHESSVDVIKWVAENDVPASLDGLQIDEENDMLDGECLFDECADPDEEEFEGYTGNAGPTVEYWYHRAVLVIWPKSRSMGIACSASFAGAVQLVLRRAQEQDPDANTHLEHIVSFAKRHPEKSQGRLAELLEAACILNHISSVRSVLQLMSRTTVQGHSSYSWRVYDGSYAGCSSAKHAKLLVKAVDLFGWKALHQLVLAAVAATPASLVGNCAILACALARSPDTSAAADAVAKAACKIMFANKFEDRAAPSVARMLFSVESCIQQKNIFLSRAMELSPATIAEVMVSVRRSHGDATSLQGFPDGLAQLVKVYIAKALQKNVAPQSCKHAAVVWSILLGSKPRNDEVLDGFCTATIETNCGELLRELLTAVKYKSLVGDCFVTRIAAARASQLTYPKPISSNCQPRAFVPRHPKVSEFLRSNQVRMEYYGFNGIGHARNFSQKHFCGYYNASENHSARAEPCGRGASAYVVIEKTNGANSVLLRQYQDDQKELVQVKNFLRQAPIGAETQDVGHVSLGCQRQPSADVVDLTED